jgi:hypothetical protein
LGVAPPSCSIFTRAELVTRPTDDIDGVRLGHGIRGQVMVGRHPGGATDKQSLSDSVEETEPDRLVYRNRSDIQDHGMYTGGPEENDARLNKESREVEIRLGL